MLDNKIKGKRVAVVGNASSILGTNQGARIDGHEVVIRINLWQPKEEEKKDVGSRTDINYIGDWIWTDVDEFKKYKEEFGTHGTVMGIPTLKKDGYIMGLLDCGLTGVICLYDCIMSGCGELSIFGFDCIDTPDRYSKESKLNLPDTELAAYKKSLVLLKDLYQKNTNVNIDAKLLEVFMKNFDEPMFRTILDKYVYGKTVSIVGGASSIFQNGNKNGAEIDSREVVIRVCMEVPLEEQDYPYVGKRTDIVYCNTMLYDSCVVDGRINGIPAVVQPKASRHHLSLAVERKYGGLLPDGKKWCPMSGVTCVYTALLAGAKEVYITGFDFYRSNNRQGGKAENFINACKKRNISPVQLLTVGGSREYDLGGESYNNSLKDELAIKAMIREGYPIVLDSVLKEIYE